METNQQENVSFSLKPLCRKIMSKRFYEKQILGRVEKVFRIKWKRKKGKSCARKETCRNGGRAKGNKFGIY